VAVIDARTRRGLVPALAGLLLGIVGVVADLPVLGLVAGVCALVVLVVTVRAGDAAARAVPQAAASGLAAASAGAASGSATAPAAAAAIEERSPRVEDVRAVQPASEPAPAPLAPSVAGLQAAREGGSSLVDAHGLFSQEYFLMAVETRVSAARRHLRPVAVVLFEVGTHDGSGRAEPALVATAIRATLREADTACRLAGDRYAFVLEDTPEDGALWTMERFRRVLQAAEPAAIRWAGIACYPAHAFSADGVLSKAEDALAAAKEWGQDRVEVATAD